MTNRRFKLKKKGVKSVPADLTPIQKPTTEKIVKRTAIKGNTKSTDHHISKPLSHNSVNSSSLIELMSSKAFIYFTDQTDRPYVHFLNVGHYEIHPVDSHQFQSFLRMKANDAFGVTIKDATLKEVIGFLSSKATCHGRKRILEYRSARKGNTIFIDIGNSERDAIKITESCWKIIPSKNVPIIFKRQSHNLPHFRPNEGGNLENLKKVIHIEDQNTWILLKVWLVTALVPDIPRPCLIFHGLHGAGKSFAGKLLRILIDPSQLDLLPTPSNQNEFIQQIANNYLIILDNLHDLKSWMSDSLCRAITGGAFMKRKLYTDCEDFILQFKRLFIINGINNPAAAPDLLDRSILIELDRIPAKHTRTEMEIMEEFKSMASGVLGNMLEILSKALSIQDSFQYPELPRMADWAKLGYAVAEAMGIGGDRFLDAYRENTQLQHVEIAENDIVASVVTNLADQEGSFTATPQQFYTRCKEILSDEAQKSRSWPKTAAIFSKRLRLVANNLREIGIDVEFLRGNERLISIKRK